MDDTINISNKQLLIQFINDNLAPKQIEKKLFGEVYTPLELVEEMLDTLPKEVWTNPLLKWLEPGSGMGNFMIGIFYRLMDGLKEFIKDDLERERYIIENMLYMVELNKANIHICRNIFKANTYKLNIYDKDYLKLDFSKECNINSFDIILGNPPYQGTGRKKIYINFIEKSINLLKKNGLLLQLVPHLSIQYLLGNEVVQKTLPKQLDIHYINCNHIGNKYFKQIESDFCYFLASNSFHNINTIINNNGTLETITLKYKTYLPLNFNKVHYNLANKFLNMGANEFQRKAIRIDKNLKDTYSPNHKQKIIYKIKTNSIDIKYTNLTHPLIDSYKVLYPTLGDNYIIDKNKELIGGTSFVVFLLCSSPDECDKLIWFKNSIIFNYLKIIFSNLRSPQDFIWRNIKKPNLLSMNNDIDLYKYFELTREEINILETTHR